MSLFRVEACLWVWFAAKKGFRKSLVLARNSCFSVLFLVCLYPRVRIRQKWRFRGVFSGQIRYFARFVGQKTYKEWSNVVFCAQKRTAERHFWYVWLLREGYVKKEYFLCQESRCVCQIRSNCIASVSTVMPDLFGRRTKLPSFVQRNAEELLNTKRLRTSNYFLIELFVSS